MSRKKKPTNGQHINGTLPGPPPGKPPAAQTLLESQDAETRRIVKTTLESFFGPTWDGFGGSDIYYDLLQDRYGDGKWVPISVVSDRKQGANWPLWRNEVELAEYRQRSRITCRKNAYARSLLSNLTNHIIGKGFSYKAQPKAQTGAAKGIAPDETTQQITTALQREVDDFCAMNRFTATISPKPTQSLVTSSRESESFRRVFRDAEAILRLFHCEGDEKYHGKTWVRFVEPEQVTDPPSARIEDGWSFGMQHKMEPFEDEEDIVTYYIKYKTDKNGQSGEEVSADEIVHIKNLEEDAAIKRGLPAFSLDTLDSLDRAAKLTRNVSISSAVRAATAEIWQHEGASEAQVQSLATRLSNPNPGQNPATGQNEYREQRKAGQTRRIPKGQVPVWPQAVGASEHIEVAQSDLRQAGAPFSAPEYFTGDASNANFSSTKEAGVPFVVMAEVVQEHFKTAFLICILKAMTHAIKCGRLPSNTLEVCEIQVTMPKLTIRDPLQQAQEDQILNTMKVKSVQTIQAERNLDGDHEDANFAEFDEKHGQPGGALPMPEDGGEQGGNPFGGGDETPPGPQLPPAPQPSGSLPGLESKEVAGPVLENFTGIDAHGHHWENGKQVAADKPTAAPAKSPPPAKPPTAVASSPDSEGKPPVDAAKHIDTWASYAAKIPAKVMAAAKTKVKSHYDKLSARYGQNTARAIIAAGIVAFPLPGGTIIGPAPIVAVAELLRWLKSRPVAESIEDWHQEAVATDPRMSLYDQFRADIDRLIEGM